MLPRHLLLIFAAHFLQYCKAQDNLNLNAPGQLAVQRLQQGPLEVSREEFDVIKDSHFVSACSNASLIIGCEPHNFTVSSCSSFWYCEQQVMSLNVFNPTLFKAMDRMKSLNASMSLAVKSLKQELTHSYSSISEAANEKALGGIKAMDTKLE